MTLLWFSISCYTAMVLLELLAVQVGGRLTPPWAESYLIGTYCGVVVFSVGLICIGFGLGIPVSKGRPSAVACVVLGAVAGLAVFGATFLLYWHSGSVVKSLAIVCVLPVVVGTVVRIVGGLIHRGG